MTDSISSLDLPNRIAYCAKLVGSKTKLAQIIGISKSSITKYLIGRNKPRPKIFLKMANAAGVSAVWLESGTGTPEISMSAPESEGSTSLQSLYTLVRQVGGLDEAIAILSHAVDVPDKIPSRPQRPKETAVPYQAQPEPLPSGFTARFTDTINDLGGIIKISELTGLARERLASLCRGDTPTLKELHTLISHRVVSLDWLLIGSGFQSSPQRRALLLNQLLFKMAAFDNAARPPRILPGNTYLGSTENTCIEGIVEFWGKTYEKISASDYICVIVPDDSMQPLLDAGDVVLIDTRKPKISSGIYLIETRSGNVIVKASNTGTKTVACYLADKDSPFEISHDASIGRAVWAFKSVSLRNTHTENRIGS